MTDAQRHVVQIGRVKDDVPHIGGEYLVLVCCNDCGRQLVRLAPGEEIVPERHLFPCSECRPGAE